MSTFRVSPEMRRLLAAEQRAAERATDYRRKIGMHPEQLAERAKAAAGDNWPQEAAEIAAAHAERAEKWDEPPCTCGACRFIRG